MYLATLKSGTATSYQLRQSYLTAEHVLSHRLVFDLGRDPTRYLNIIDEYLVVFDDKLLQAVFQATGEKSDAVLEGLLLDFLPPETRRRLALFRCRTGKRPGPLSDQEKTDIDGHVHLFDKRRLYYLRYGAVDQSRLSRLHPKCCRPLLVQSRDEREYAFAAEEAFLEPGHYLQYVYAAFNIQKHFHQSFAAWFPEALAREEVADHFLDELCVLNEDKRFWQDQLAEGKLHHHLHRYLFMFFDFNPAGRSFTEDFSERFRAEHRRFRWPERKSAKSPEKISEVFATPYDDLMKMDGTQLSRLYRRQAMQLHPDRGGDHDLFILLTEVYRHLLLTKK